MRKHLSRAIRGGEVRMSRWKRTFGKAQDWLSLSIVWLLSMPLVPPSLVANPLVVKQSRIHNSFTHPQAMRLILQGLATGGRGR